MNSEIPTAAVKESAFYKYHHATKHTVESLFSSGHRLDWASQPEPFLHYEGARLIDLPHEFVVSSKNYFETLESSFKSADEKPMAADLKFISNLLFYSMSISAWKQVVGTNNRWALRVNASSGNLHPTDTNVLIGDGVDGLSAGLYHFRVDQHKLEERTTGDLIRPLMERLQPGAAPPPVVICLSSVFFREAWKYRDRAFRYCQHDLGHALAAVTLSARTLGWTARVICLFPDEEVGEFLGMNRMPVTANERPLALILLSSKSENIPEQAKCDLLPNASGDLLKASSCEKRLPSASRFDGRQNRLTTELITYQSIENVYQSTLYSFEDMNASRERALDYFSRSRSSMAAGAVVASEEPIALVEKMADAAKTCLPQSVHKTIRRRRSAVDMDGETGMSKEELSFIMQAATGGFSSDFLGSPEEGYFVHLYLYVHRVSGLARGLYLYDRGRKCLLPLVLCDQRELAMSTSCFQEIASDGSFSISMVADFNNAYRLFGDRCYRLVHYEAGFIGQHLYLAACAFGHDATGIGCFVDDAINHYLALDEGNEVIYNFTFGKAVFDPRLTTLPSYSFSDPALDSPRSR